MKLGELAKVALVKPDGTGLDEKWSVGVGYMPSTKGGSVKAVPFTAKAKAEVEAKAKAQKRKGGDGKGAARARGGKKRKKGGGN